MNKEERYETIKKHKDKGVVFVDEETAYIEASVVIGKGTKIYPNVVLEGDTVIGENAIIGMSSNIVSSLIGDEVEIQMSVVKNSTIGKDTIVGPFAYIRPNSHIGEKCKVGDFVEVKNSTLGDGSKASHLTYIGDADIGKDVNLGCGVVFVNYDGVNKYRSTIEDNAFIGCNSNIVSPVTVGKSAYVAAATTVTKNVSEDSLCIGRVKAEEKQRWLSPKKKAKRK